MALVLLCVDGEKKKERIPEWEDDDSLKYSVLSAQPFFRHCSNGQWGG